MGTVRTDSEDRLEERLLLNTGVAASKRSWGRLVRVVVMLVAVQISFAGNGIITKLALTGQGTDPIIFSLLRDIGGAAILLSAAHFHGGIVWPRREDAGTFVLLGVLGVYIGQMFLTMSLQYISAINAALLQPSQPVLTTLLAAVFGVEPLGLGTLHGQLKLVGIMLAAGGAVFTVYCDSMADAAARHNGTTTREHRAAASDLIFGNGLLIAQCLSGACYQLLQKHLLSSAKTEYPPLSVAGVGYLVGAVAIGLVLPVCHADAASWSWLWRSPTSAYALAYAIFMTSAFNYALQAYANKHSSPTLVTAFFPLQVVFAALLSWLVFGKLPRTTEYIGGMMILVGLAAVTAGRVHQARLAKGHDDSV